MIESKDDLFDYFNDIERSSILEGTLARKNLSKTSAEVSQMTVKKLNKTKYEIKPTKAEQTPRKIAKKQVSKIIEFEKAKTSIDAKKIKTKPKSVAEIKKEAKRREKRVLKLYKELNKNNLKRYRQRIEEQEEELSQFEEEYDRRRITPPKKRNFISRLHLANKYQKGKFELAEEDAEMIKNGEILTSSLDKKEWKAIQKYEDARDDIRLRKGFTAFKVALAGIALVGVVLGGGYVVKTTIDDMHEQFAQMEELYIHNQSKANQEMMEKRAASMAMNFRDQEFFYEYTNGNPSLENWENLPEAIQECVRNPVTAAEAAYNHDNDQSHFYVMVDGDFTTEKWEALPEEVKQYIREPVSTAKEAYENGKDQVYLYQLSRGIITEEFWQGLPSEVRQYVRNPLELAKSYAKSGDELGYLKELLRDGESPQKLDHNFWSFLPDELKEVVKDPKLITPKEDVELAQKNNSNEEEVR